MYKYKTFQLAKR